MTVPPACARPVASAGCERPRPASSSDTRLVALFLEMLASERGAAANTLDAYRRDLDDFAGYLATSGARLETAGSDAVRAYLADLSQRSDQAEALLAGAGHKPLARKPADHRDPQLVARRGVECAQAAAGAEAGRGAAAD